MATKKTIGLKRPDINQLIAFVFNKLPEQDTLEMEEHLWNNDYDACTVDSMLEIVARKGFSEEELKAYLNEAKTGINQQVEATLNQSEIANKKLNALSPDELGRIQGGFQQRIWYWFRERVLYPRSFQHAFFYGVILSLILSTASIRFLFSKTLEGNNSNGVVALFNPGNYSEKPVTFYQLNPPDNLGFSIKDLLLPLKPIPYEGLTHDSIFLQLEESLFNTRLSILSSCNTKHKLPSDFSKIIACSDLYQIVDQPKNLTIKELYKNNPTLNVYINGFPYSHKEEFQPHLLKQLSLDNIQSIKISNIFQNKEFSKLEQATKIEIDTKDYYKRHPGVGYQPPPPSYRMDLYELAYQEPNF